MSCYDGAINMKRLAILAVLLPSIALAQQPPPMSSTAAFTGQLASLLTETMTERDGLRAQLQALQKELADAKAAAKPAEGMTKP